MFKAAALSLTLFLTTMFGANIAQAHHVNTSKRVVQVNRYLAGSPMSGIAPILEKEGKIYNVSPYFIAAVATKESSNGFASCSNNPKNVWGLGACGRAWNPPYFRTWTQAVNYFVRFVRGKAGVSNGWPNATSPWHFNGYCSGCETSWASAVVKFMYRMGSNSNITY